MNVSYSVESVLKQVSSGQAPEFLFFWGHRPDSGGAVMEACLSQWWPAPFVVSDQHYPTAEHFMMAQKACLFGDKEALESILNAPDPRAAKRFGRSIRNFDESHWRAERMRIVVEGNLAKFSQHEDLRTFLLGTGERILVEASPYDRIWGIGLAVSESGIENPENWRGLNLLGFALMTVRDRLADIAA